jgi:hypothetical protein
MVVMCAVVSTLLCSCDDGTPTTGPEDCTNGRDDDGDRFPDCIDVDCRDHPACRPHGDGDADADEDGDADSDAAPDGDGDVDSDTDTDTDTDTDGDGDGDGDSDTDTDSDTDGDTDGDVDTDEDASDAEPYCPEDAGTCIWECETDLDCVVALDMMSCCGGHPHEGADPGVLVVCPTAVHRARFDEDSCVIAYDPRAPLPDPPARCDPICDGLVCGPCTSIARGVCRERECVGVPPGGCVSDEECAEGLTCADPDGDGIGTCGAGTHACAIDGDCTATHADCDGCRCSDTTGDGFRDCNCWGCPAGVCAHDGQCAAHEFCIDFRCQFAGDDACRMTYWDCDPGFRCEPSAERPSRGLCVPMETPEDGGAG